MAPYMRILRLVGWVQIISAIQGTWIDLLRFSQFHTDSLGWRPLALAFKTPACEHVELLALSSLGMSMGLYINPSLVIRVAG